MFANDNKSNYKMKKIFFTAIALTVFAIMTTPSCINSSSGLDKFLGQWKRIDQADKDTVTIMIEDDAIIGVAGKDTCAALYNKKSDVLKFYVWGQPGVVTYIKKTGHLLLNNGKDGEFKRVK
jgi:hypothetical protein